jgi:surface carbohydrate biosynthesis protein (TIGR04326 family)
VLDNAREAGDPVLLLEECVRLRDALWIFLATFRRPARPVRRLEMGGVDLTEFLRDELRDGASFWTLQFAFVAKTLRRRGIRPELVIHLFENASWEKALALGMRRQLPDTRIVGYQHSTLVFRLSTEVRSRRDFGELDAPDVIVANGRLWEQVLVERGFASERLRSGPALRFTNVLARLERPPEMMPRDAERPCVLIAGAGGYDEALELVCKALEALAGWNARLLVKLHPSMPNREGFFPAALRILGLDALPPGVEVTTKAMPELLDQTDVLVQTKTSTVYEALAHGVPVVLVRSDFWLDRSQLPPDAGVALLARSPEEIAAAVRRTLDEPEAEARERRARTRALLEQAFTPVDERSLNAFLEPV